MDHPETTEENTETTEAVSFKPRKQLSERELSSRRQNLQKAIEAKKAKALLKKKTYEEELELETLKSEKQEAIKKKEKEMLEKEIQDIRGRKEVEEDEIQDEDIVQKPVKTDKKKKKKIIEVSEDSSSSEEEIIVRRRKPHKKEIPVYQENDYVKLVQESAQNQLRKKLEEDKIRIAMSSLFR